MAATRIMSIHIGKGKTARQCFTERLDYIMNPQKTDGGTLISLSPAMTQWRYMKNREIVTRKLQNDF